MKKTYKILIWIIVAISAIFVALNKFFSIQITGGVLGYIGALIYISPVVYLLWLLSKDESISLGKRIVSKIFMWFISTTVFVTCCIDIIVNFTK